MASVKKRRWTHKGVTKEAWVLRYSDHGGKKRLKTFATKKDADKHRTKIQIELEGGFHVADAASMTIREAGEKWLDVCELRMKLKDRMARHTAEGYGICARKHIYPFIGSLTLAKLTAPIVQQWVYDLAQHPTEPRGFMLIKYAVACLRGLLTEALRQGCIGQNVVKNVPPRVPGQKPKRIKIPTKAELKTIFDAADKPAVVRGRGATASALMRIVLYIAVFTGMRKGEILGLTWAHVDFGENIIRVRQNADRWGNLGPPKSEAGVRDIPMAPVLIIMLREWKMACPVTDLNLVFPSQKRTVMRPYNLHYYLWIPLMERAGLVKENGRSKYHFHALRHCAASLYIEQGLPPKQVQTIMGHATMAMTYDRYGHLFEDNTPPHAAVAAIERDLLG